MPKITRATQKIFAQNGTDQLAAFGSMKTGTPIYTDNIEDLQTSDYEDGWENAIVADEAPFLEEMNGVQYGFSKQLAYLFQEGIAEYDAETTYYKNSIVKGANSDGVMTLWYSLTDNNIGNNPADDTTEINWKVLDLGGKWGSIEGNIENQTDLQNELNSKLNTNQITNCILEAPNGVATYSGNTITIKQGLKVLIPNGRNADGTLKNVEYTFSQDKNIKRPIETVLDKINRIVAFDVDNEKDLLIEKRNYIEQSEEPVYDDPLTIIWYNPLTNIYKYRGITSSQEEWVQANITIIADFVNTKTSIESLTPFQPFRAVDQNDTEFIAHQAMPSDKRITLSVLPTESQYIAPVDGYVTFILVVSGSGTDIYISLTSGSIVNVKHLTKGPSNSLTIPVRKGDNFAISYQVSGGFTISSKSITFCYAEGAQ